MSSCRTGGVMNSPNLWKPWNMPRLDSNTSGKPSYQKRNDCYMNCAYQYKYPKLLWKYQQWLNMYIRHIYWYLTDVHKKYLNEISLTCQALTSTHLRLLNWSNDSCRSGEGESPTDRVLSNKKQRGTLAPSKNLKDGNFCLENQQKFN